MKTFTVAAALLFPALALAASPSPYAGQESRQIKALSASEQADLLAGKGMGLAKPAELNGYPGPAHVLELASQLSLSAEQLAKTQTLFSAMEQRAQELGRQLVAAEQSLDGLFASKRATEPALRELLARIGELQAKVRAAHLEAHLEQARILSVEQTALYAQLRGYSQAGASTEGPGHGHKH